MIRLPFLLTILSSLLLLSGCAASQPIHYQIDSRFSVHEPDFLRTLSGLTGSPLPAGNDVRTYSNGDEMFPAMLEAIAAARKTITFEIYSYEKSDIGKTFTDALCQRAQAGVNVNVLVDAVGAATIDPAWKQQMNAAGVHLCIYHPIKLFDPASYPKTEHRTHRKLLILDGTIGFIGGVGIGDEWTGHAQDANHWRDNVYRVTGPVVTQLQSAFCDNWMETCGIVLQGPDFFPPLTPVQSPGMTAQVFRNSAAGGSQTMQLLFLLSVAAARQSICLESPYFIPDGQTEDALLAARRRGVSIQILVPGKYIDVEAVRDASRARWGNLLKAGVEIYEFQPTMLHAKLMIVDNLWTSIGSSNLDNRSFALNAEANLNVYDPDFAAQQMRMFHADCARARRVTFEQWAHRPLPERISNALATFISPEL